MAWTVAAERSLTYGEGIKTPGRRAYRLRLLATMEAAWFNRRLPESLGRPVQGDQGAATVIRMFESCRFRSPG
jgi:hypothetical protein